MEKHFPWIKWYLLFGWRLAGRKTRTKDSHFSAEPVASCSDGVVDANSQCADVDVKISCCFQFGTKQEITPAHRCTTLFFRMNSETIFGITFLRAHHGAVLRLRQDSVNLRVRQCNDGTTRCEAMMKVSLSVFGGNAAKP